MFHTNRRPFYLSILTFLVLTGCSAPGLGNVRNQGVQDHWSETVAIEDQAEAQFATIVQSTNEGYQAIKISYPLAEECFVESGAVIRDAVAGRYDSTTLDNDPDNAPTGEVNGFAIGQALLVNEAYPGDVAICQEMKAQIATDVTIWRQDRSDQFRGLWDTKRLLDGRYQGELFASMAVDLLQFAQDEAQKLGVPLPSYVYPTFHLEASSRDQAICTYYDMEWNPALQNCTLNGKAAYEYIFRPFVAAEVQGSFDSGVDDLNPLGDDG